MTEQESYGIMLGQIANVVESYCISEQMTTLDAVKSIEASLRKAEAELVIRELEEKYRGEGIAPQ